MEFLSCVANRMVNEIRRMNRVVYNATSRRPGTIEWE
jgi:GMP synthase (glutamine-hydrolysing)